MPSMSKVKGGYKVYNKETGKSKFVKHKKQAEDMVKKGYSKSKKVINKIKILLPKTYLLTTVDNYSKQRTGSVKNVATLYCFKQIWRTPGHA